ncbi:alpha/beta fold hydrolase [Kiloniella sp.]|uniref:alpha/beta fold hydrolase n=1 Tax=Kiloniella sp. TaxID=1938587 RepID=UPI003B012221
MTLFEELDQKLLPGFERKLIAVDGKDVLTLVGGSGPPLLMLHGDPQTHLCWHLIAPRLAERFTVVLTDIRGRGETHKPGISAHNIEYSKRSMAAEQLQVMSKLGFTSFSLVGHDRGARVARRLALDHPQAVEQLAVMDVVPAYDFYKNTTAEIAQEYYYFFFLTQPHPMPEALIGGDPTGFMSEILTGLSPSQVPYDEATLELYLKAASTPEATIAMCECFRAGFGIDRQHDIEDRKTQRQIQCPTLVMWGEKGIVGRHFDIRQIWDGWCKEPQYAPIQSGHFIPEEAPDEAYTALNTFLS